MNSIISDYLNTYDKFELFSATHWFSIGLFIFLVIFLPWYANRFLSRKNQKRIAKIIGVIVFINFPLWIFLELLAGSFDFSLHLPLHLCRFANLMILPVMFYRSDRVFQILYYWGLSGMFQGIISPDFLEDFPHFHYFRYFAGHHLLVVGMIYAVIVYDLKPTLIGMKNAFIGINIFLLIAFIFNILLDANYFWIMGKPPAGSLLDYMGPWPWYILIGEFVALIHFIIAYFIYLMIEKFRPNKIN